MKVLIQRVNSASVKVEDEIIGEINRGILLFVGFSNSFKIEYFDKIINKILNLRIFENELVKNDKSIIDIGGEILVISQFTLHASLKKGRRPDFTNSMNPKEAESYYNKFIASLKKSGLKVQTGKFGANMKINLVNDGPVTLIVDHTVI